MRSPGFLVALIALTLGLAASAHAGTNALGLEPASTEAPPNLLPAGETAPPSALVDAALRLPATRMAMRQMAAAGFARAPGADVAKTHDGRACVTLAYLDPAHPTRAPLVIVMSDPTVVPARAWVASAVFDVDVSTGTVALAPDAPPGAESLVTIADMNSMRPGDYARASGSVRQKLMKWLECSLLGCGAGGAVCTVVGTVLGPLAPPAIGGCVIATCATVSYLCMW